MGLSSSKHNAPGSLPPSSSSSSSSAAVIRRSRSSSGRVFKSSCLRSHSYENHETPPQVSDWPSEGNRENASRPCENKSVSCQFSAECYRKDKSEERDDMNPTIPDPECDEWDEPSFANTVSRDGNNSGRAFSSRPVDPPNRFQSRFTFHPRSLSFRLTRANSLRCARAHPASSTSCTVSNDEEEGPSLSGCSLNRNDRPQGCDFLPSCFPNRSSRIQHDNCTSRTSQPIHCSPDFPDNLQDNRQFDSDRNALRNRNCTRINYSSDLLSPINHSSANGSGLRHVDRHSATAREPVEQNVQFSRTLSVGRLRDRVLRRRLVPDLGLYNLQRHQEMRRSRRITERQVLDSSEATSDSNSSDMPAATNNISSNVSIPFHGNQNLVHETPRARETRYGDLLEHRPNFLERRRRIRYQVRALQRLGSRFENLSGHERSCILSGQHRGGHCMCRNSAREVNPNDDATARASISRIVMLAEALFEVLDEIHEQSVVLSSRPSASSIGSVPAPNQVVDSLPLKIFSNLKRKQCEEVAQCYICLIEYEEGDSMRVLPCHHEFHKACVDKWLKEIHRVCPLCRGDICQTNSLISES